jgi:hypothetical protein
LSGTESDTENDDTLGLEGSNFGLSSDDITDGTSSKDDEDLLASRAVHGINSEHGVSKSEGAG